MPPKPRKKFKPKLEQAKLAEVDQAKKAEEQAKHDKKNEEIRIKREEKEKRFGDRAAGGFKSKKTLQERSVFDTEVPMAVRRGAMSGSTLSIRGSEGMGSSANTMDRRPVIKKEAYETFFSKTPIQVESKTSINPKTGMPVIMEDGEEPADENMEYDDIIGSTEAFVEYRDAENQTMPIKLERLKENQEVRVDKILDMSMLRDELMILQFPHNLPAFVYNEKNNTESEKSSKENQETTNDDDSDDDFEAVQADCDNYPQGRFGTIRVYESKRTGLVRSRFELCTKEKDQEDSVQVKFDIHSTHDSLVAQELFSIQPPREDLMVDEKKPEIVVLGACTKKLVCTPIVDKNK